MDSESASKKNIFSSNFLNKRPKSNFFYFFFNFFQGGGKMHLRTPAGHAGSVGLLLLRS